MSSSATDSTVALTYAVGETYDSVHSLPSYAVNSFPTAYMSYSSTSSAASVTFSTFSFAKMSVTSIKNA